MQDLALYRKYRPETFDDVIGQDHVVSVLKKSLKEGKIAHAYLLTGTRGIGKTTIARIIARELGTSANDIYEIDAASNRGIDDIRELRDGVTTLPFDSKYKVYIIDEVHMLTKEAFNALLKTLEEPPAHVIFILATTDLVKVPETIVSRCQSYVFKQPSEQILAETVHAIAKKEGYSFDKESAELIALLGDGSFRDTLGTLQKVLSSASDKKVSITDVERITGAPRKDIVNSIIEALIRGDVEKSLTAVRMAGDEQVSMPLLTRLILEKCRAVLLARFAPSEQDILMHHFSERDQKFLSDLAKEKSKTLTSTTLVRLIEAVQMQSFCSVPTLPLELALIDILGGGEEKK